MPMAGMPATAARGDHRLAARLACLLLAIGLGGCASTPHGTPRNTGVGQQMIEPAGATRREMASHQAFVMPRPLANPAPAFPDDYRPAGELSATLCAAVVVAEDGAVRGITPIDAPGCVAPEAAPAPLEASVRSAVSAWRFSPAMLCTYPDAATRDRDWNGHGCAGQVEQARHVAVTLAWAFTFSLRDGQPQVTSMGTGPR